MQQQQSKQTIGVKNMYNFKRCVVALLGFTLLCMVVHAYSFDRAVFKLKTTAGFYDTIATDGNLIGLTMINDEGMTTFVSGIINEQGAFLAGGLCGQLATTLSPSPNYLLTIMNCKRVKGGVEYDIKGAQTFLLENQYQSEQK